MLDWNFDRNVSTITLDNCITNDAIIDSNLDKVDSSTFLLDGKILHMRCCAHILNLIVKDGLEEMGDGIERIRDSVYFWTATPSRHEKFEEAARQLKIPYKKKLATDCKTRWNSAYLMLQVALMYKDVFPPAKQRDRLYTNVPTNKDWERGKEICAKLKLSHSATELFSRSSYPTSNFYFQKVCEIKIALSTWLESPLEIIRVMASKMLVKYEKYWNVCHEVMAVAMVLDPRYKMKLVEYYFNKIYGKEALVEVQRVQQICVDLLFEYQNKSSSNKSMVGGSSSNITSLDEEMEVAEDDDMMTRTNSLNPNILIALRDPECGDAYGYNSAIPSGSVNIGSSHIPFLTGDNYSDWKEKILLTLGCMDIDLALRVDEPPIPTESSKPSEKGSYERWE
ncbi:zinc finger BED domain-containing protein RICESLEEPER 2-like [Cornus florida]|uniref:zinc finger BED domain-containing protein RICESLEEPER 2-like n=1 Tax=Cornus florida TaxID=4283 RepID=UPI0028A0D551|nr:zinc finger BED domain-containing protein RICESLEEPER 2-like [Cornus florida]